MADDVWYSPNRQPDAPRQRRVGELLFEFSVERTKTFYRCELFDHGEWGVEAQFLGSDQPADRAPVPSELESDTHAARDGERVGD